MVKILNKPAPHAKRGFGKKSYYKSKAFKEVQRASKAFHEENGHRLNIARSVPFWKSGRNPITLQLPENIIFKNGNSSRFLPSHSLQAEARCNGRPIVSSI